MQNAAEDLRDRSLHRLASSVVLVAKFLVEVIVYEEPLLAKGKYPVAFVVAHLE